MASKIIFCLFIVVMSGVGLFLLYYGIKGGLIDKKILVNAWQQEFVTGKGAVFRGWIYIFLGLLSFVVLFAAIIDTLTH